MKKKESRIYAGAGVSQTPNISFKSVAIRDAVYLTQRICAYTRHDHNLDQYYIKADALRLLELSEYIGDKEMAKAAHDTLNVLDNLETDLIKKTKYENSEDRSDFDEQPR